MLVPGSILLGPLPFLGILVLVYGLSSFELLALFRTGRKRAVLFMTTGAGTLVPVVFLLLHRQMDPLWLLLPFGSWMIGYIWAGFPGYGPLVLVWLAIPFALFYATGWISEPGHFHWHLPISIIALVWINDTFAYVVGSLLGRHKLTPLISPGKTWEGLAGGILFTLFGGWIFHLLWDDYPLFTHLILSLIVVFFGLAGDLFESQLKRKKQVKNTGRLLPGHGGILDRFDSLLLAAPAVFLFMVLLNQFK